MPLHQCIAFSIVKHEIFKRGARLHRPLALHLVHQRHRLPVAAQQLPGWRPWADARHQLVLLAADHCVSSL
jgi:hypothetical protein